MTNRRIQIADARYVRRDHEQAAFPLDEDVGEPEPQGFRCRADEGQVRPVTMTVSPGKRTAS